MMPDYEFMQLPVNVKDGIIIHHEDGTVNKEQQLTLDNLTEDSKRELEALKNSKEQWEVLEKLHAVQWGERTQKWEVQLRRVMSR